MGSYGGFDQPRIARMAGSYGGFDQPRIARMAGSYGARVRRRNHLVGARHAGEQSLTVAAHF